VVHLQQGERRVQESVCAEGNTENGGDAQQLSPQRQPSQTDPEVCAKVAKVKGGIQENDEKEVEWRSKSKEVGRRDVTQLRLLHGQGFTNPGVGGCDCWDQEGFGKELVASMLLLCDNVSSHKMTECHEEKCVEERALQGR
jgi:IS5 family transposase